VENFTRNLGNSDAGIRCGIAGRAPYSVHRKPVEDCTVIPRSCDLMVAGKLGLSFNKPSYSVALGAYIRWVYGSFCSSVLAVTKIEKRSSSLKDIYSTPTSNP
jgi:hypothetical protein